MTLPILFGEIALRIIFRDGGRTTLGAPGRQEFAYRYRGEQELRTPQIDGPKAPGTKRIAIFGDSITWGIGVYDYHRLYAERLLRLLNHTQPLYDMQVYAYGGKNIDGHLRAAELAMPTLDADYVIYQWYSNDVEVGVQQHMPIPWWENWEGHDWLDQHSYLYQFLDSRAGQLRVDGWGGPSFLDSFKARYAEGTPGWTLFCDQFHRWAEYATAYAPHTLVFLYPHVPFRGTYPLAEINNRMVAMAKPHALTYPASWLYKRVGADVPEAGGTGGKVRKSDGTAGVLVYGPNIPLVAGSYAVTYRLRLDAPSAAAAGNIIGSLDILAKDHHFAHRDLTAQDFGGSKTWIDITLPFTLAERLTTDVEWDVTVAEGVKLSVDRIGLPVTYHGLDVIDLRDRLNTFKTHASMFDSHPNERAHAELATALAEWVKAHP